MLLKVLIAEDEEIIRKGLVYAINWLDMGCVVTATVKDGAEGLEMIGREKPDIVLADIHMPRMSGLEMIEKGLEIHKFHSIILTSYSEFELTRQAIQIGVTGYLLKPVVEDEVREIIEKIRRRVEEANKYKKIEKIVEDRILTEGADWKIFEMAEKSLDPYVKQTYEIIKSQFREKLGINSVADQLGISPSFLSRRLKSNLNATFVDILNQFRVKEAIRMLEKGTMRIYEISDDLGFSEYKYFCSVFKRYTGTSPTEFMKNGGSKVVSRKADGESR